MILKEKDTLFKAKNDIDFMDDLLRSAEAEKFIKYVIKSYTKNPAVFMLQNKVEWEDLYQACLIGLFNGLKKLDLDRDPSEWVRYLYLSIQGEIRNFSRSNQSNSIVISQKIRMLYPKYMTFYHFFREKFGKDPTISDAMKEFQISRNEAFELVYGMQELVSVFQETGEINQAFIKGPFEDVEKKVINSLLIKHYMPCLNNNEKRVLHLYYFLGFNKTEIAKMIGCGNSMVQRHMVNAFKKIRKMEVS
ncbi:sigma-70 family RNA polymerase sigma factor [Bacillus sp. JJ1533]|uniref:sigma-70 family RNA polymerase sigma factor n=1 Tax=Bacillus sp. JJ1533 TaxID=3122959 RepID=UPI002FFEE137